MVGKKNRSKQQRKYQRTKNSSTSTVLIIVMVSVLVIGLGTWLGLRKDGGTGDTVNGAPVSLADGQNISSLESRVDALTAQVKNDPKNAVLQEDLGTALFNLANAYIQINDSRATETLNKTIEVYNETLKLNPDSKETLGDLATAYFYTNQVDQAIVTVEKALKIDPNFLPAIMNYGIYLASGKGDYAKAIEQWEKIPAGTPQYEQAQSLIQQYKN